MKPKTLHVLLYSFIAGNVILFLLLFIIRAFPAPLMWLHISSILLLWGLVVWKTDAVPLVRTKWVEGVLIAGFVLVSLIVGLHQIEDITPGMYPDEVGVATWGEKLLQRSDVPPFVGEGYFHPTPLLYLTGMSVEAYGNTMTAIRLPSVVFGALAVGLFYILLRLFFPLPFAALGAVLLLFQYTHIVLMRLAYEPPASLFFQLLALIFLALYWKKRETVYLVGIALALGGGMYTYLNFRAFAAIVCVLTLVLLLRRTWKKQGREALLFVGLIFAAIAPLVSFALIDPQGFWGRASEISIFGRNYPPDEFVKELWGNIVNTLGFPFRGDPNPGKNPSGVTMFDPVTMCLAAVGLVLLWLKQRNLFYVVLLFLIPPAVSDIFSTEVIPEFHYYGLGHPNALRVSGFIPVVLFAAVAAWYWIFVTWGKQKKAEMTTAVVIAVTIISIFNLHWYFNQAQNHQMFFVYNYKYNHAQKIKTAKLFNQMPATSLLMTNDLAENGMAEYFLNDTKQMKTFDVTATASAMQEIVKADAIAVGLTQQSVGVVNEMLDDIAAAGYATQVLTDPVGSPDVLIIVKPYATAAPF